MLIEAAKSYLAVRRAAGYKLKVHEIHLRSFARFAAERGEAHVCARSAMEWAARASSPGERDRRLKAVIVFARHAHAEEARHEIPPDGVFGHHRQRRVPFIFTPTDIRRLIEQALCLGPPGSLRPHTYSTLLGLLWATGLRISEALALRLDDITADGLVIRQTKFRKSRLVPLHETAVAGLERYLDRRRHLATSDDHIFVTLHGRGLRYQTIYGVFRALVQEVGIKPGRDRPVPHIHDLRHAFAVRALEACPLSRDQVGRHLLALSTYMGHAHVADTYWYLEATSQLMGDIARAWESFVKGEAR